MPKIRRAEMDKYGETKKRYQIMLTETALEALDKVAEDLGVTRSEYIERWIRRELLDEAELKQAMAPADAGQTIARTLKNE